MYVDHIFKRYKLTVQGNRVFDPIRAVDDLKKLGYHYDYEHGQLVPITTEESRI